jgi:hypothetical protein
MTILLAFAPFILFAIVERLAGVTAGLLCGTGASLVLIIRDAISSYRKVKVLEIGTVLVFAGLALYNLATGAVWSMVGVRLRVDLGLLMIVLVSLAIQLPFTLQYAREQVAQDLWKSPEFVRTNYVITSVWAAAFALLVAADLMMLYIPTLPLRVGIWTTIAAIVGAMKFTQWYPERARTSPEAVGR